MSESLQNLRIGTGFDVHAFTDNRKLILGGVEINHPKGLSGHSDADVLVHAIMDALLGASGLGDIGILFPDNNELFRNISSILLLKKVYDILTHNNISIISIDSVVICETPKIRDYIPSMKSAIAAALHISDSRIGIKGTTTEKLGFTGRGEGIAAQASALISVK